MSEAKTPVCRNFHDQVECEPLTECGRGFRIRVGMGGYDFYVCPTCGLVFAAKKVGSGARGDAE